ncbi:MAG: UDP-N-acetylmuramyl pentapeptide phosphotransferase/UDP-N-acetylglucosamine-1-phosphate transferase [Candidatus Levybacteria bacterium GW2011_GWA1_37_16]|nr:MAG: UDP-N-acetylmuramyl pentapeptide phosphotransferase/UDP-N-acetylglucosamine-1-phosphate transferase [Candidatus Levybacteria bacterium GW2011_GWA1_37_16]
MTIFFPLIIAFLVTAIVTPISLGLIKKMGLLDDPKIHKHPGIIHKKITPRGGGIPLFIGTALTGIFFLPLSETVVALFTASFIALLIGVLDDKYDVSPYARFIGNIVVALIVVRSGITIPFITNPFGGILYLNSIILPFSIALSDIVAILWIIWVMNMLNWSKGVDGQMPGIVAISAITIGFLSLRFAGSDHFSKISLDLSFIIAGASLGFLIFNFHPAKIFPGYGATAIYLLLSAASILSGAKLATAILVMGIPMTDGLFTIIRRLLSGRSPFWHDKKHLHHLLLGFGLGQRRIALFYWIISAILGTLALVLSSTAKLFAIIMLLIIVGGTLIFLHRILNKTYDKDRL